MTYERNVKKKWYTYESIPSHKVLWVFSISHIITINIRIDTQYTDEITLMLTDAYTIKEHAFSPKNEPLRSLLEMRKY